jgi:adenylate cyclase
MEKNIAVLIADLSGYSALTETHGSVIAADVIEKYIEIAQNSLVGDCRLHERVGDEIMIVSSCPDHLIVTALMILNNTSTEKYFLQVHGGLHYGKVLQRGNSYFGSTINLTSRIAAKANAGSVLCSDEFVKALSDRSMFTLIPQGSHRFKNIIGEKEVFELNVGGQKSYEIDPICRMLIQNPQHAKTHTSSDGHYFCSPACLEMYQQRENQALIGRAGIHVTQPDRYLSTDKNYVRVFQNTVTTMPYSHSTFDLLNH